MLFTIILVQYKCAKYFNKRVFLRSLLTLFNNPLQVFREQSNLKHDTNRSKLIECYVKFCGLSCDEILIRSHLLYHEFIVCCYQSRTKISQQKDIISIRQNIQILKFDQYKQFFQNSVTSNYNSVLVKKRVFIYKNFKNWCENLIVRT